MDVNHPSDSAMISTGQCYGDTPEHPTSNSISVVYTEDDNCTTSTHSLVLTVGDPSTNCVEIMGLSSEYYSVSFNNDEKTYDVNLFCDAGCGNCEVSAADLKIDECFDGTTNSVKVALTEKLDTCFGSTTTTAAPMTTIAPPQTFYFNHYQGARVPNNECGGSEPGQFVFHTEVVLSACSVGYNGSYFKLYTINPNDDDADDDDNASTDFMLDLECNSMCAVCNKTLALDLDECRAFGESSFLIKGEICLGGLDNVRDIPDGSLSVVRYDAAMECSVENSTSTIVYNFGTFIDCQPMDENSFGSVYVNNGKASLNLFCDENCTNCHFQVTNMPVECFTAATAGFDLSVVNTTSLDSCALSINSRLSNAAIAAIAAGVAAGVILVVAFGWYIAKYKKRSDYTPLDD